MYIRTMQPNNAKAKRIQKKRIPSREIKAKINCIILFDVSPSVLYYSVIFYIYMRTDPQTIPTWRIHNCGHSSTPQVVFTASYTQRCKADIQIQIQIRIRMRIHFRPWSI